MKNIRTFLMCFLVVAGAGVISGCATTTYDSYTTVNDRIGLEKPPPSPTEGMTALEKTGYYLGWLSLDVLYALAASNPSFSP